MDRVASLVKLLIGAAMCLKAVAAGYAIPFPEPALLKKNLTAVRDRLEAIDLTKAEFSYKDGQRIERDRVLILRSTDLATKLVDLAPESLAASFQLYAVVGAIIESGDDTITELFEHNRRLELTFMEKGYLPPAFDRVRGWRNSLSDALEELSGLQASLEANLLRRLELVDELRCLEKRVERQR